MPIFWWVHKWTHAKFILRELTCLSVAFYALVLLFQIRALTQSQEAYTSFLELLKTPVSIVLHGIAPPAPNTPHQKGSMLLFTAVPFI